MAELKDRLQTALGSAYRLERELGGGGMSRVFVAEDAELGRKVVVKVLPPEMGAGVNAERFRREIQLAASLQHPHIVPLLHAGRAEDLVYYTMPLIEGQSLRAKIAHEGELPIPEAVRIMRDVADALAYAHTHGVVHRDIKPDNVLVSGHHAVVMDFGVAKAISAATGESSLTSMGVALGTPAYMAPEQAAADPHVDHRCDIYALGALAYEALTGRPPFLGSNPQQVLAAQVTQAPDPVGRHRAAVPPALAALVMRCLEKKPADRWQTAAELHTQLEVMATPSGGTTPTSTRPVAGIRIRRGLPRVAWAAVAVVVLGGLGLALLRPSGGGPPIVFGQTRQVTLEAGLELDPALSPDGRLVAYASGVTGDMRIYVRSVTGGSIIPVSRGLPGEHRMPRWSPDGTQILFSGPGAVYVVPSLGGAPRAVATGRFAAWSPDGREIVFVAPGDTLSVRGVAGGAPRAVATGLALHTPDWSPDGRLIAYVSGNPQYAYGGTVLGNLGPSAVFVVPAAGGEPVQVTDRSFLHASPVWMPDGRTLLLVSSREGGRDVYRVSIGGGGAPRGPLERLTTGLSAGTIGVSRDGRELVYSVFANTANIWAIRIPSGAPISVREAVPVTSGTQHIEGVAVSADGQWLAFDSDRGGNVDIYKMPIQGGEPVQLTTDPHDDFIPAWSPDGQWIAFHTWRSGNRDVFVMSAQGGNEQRVTDDPAHDFYPAWSPDGRSLAFQSDRTGGSDIFTVELRPTGWGQPQQRTGISSLAAGAPSPGTASSPKWSPDGRRIAFTSSTGIRVLEVATDQSVLALAPFTYGGKQYAPQSAVWSRDGRTLYVKAVNVPDGSAFFAVSASGGAPRLLVRFDDPTRLSNRGEFSTDGRRFYFTVDNRQSDVWVMDVR